MKKGILIFALMFMLLSVSFVSARYCNSNDVLGGLRKALYAYYVDPSESGFTPNELKALLSFYVGIESGQITIDCTSQSNEIDRADALDDNIPSCSDGTKYGKCNNDTKPIYCYAGTLVPRCRLCGCPDEEWCDETYVYTEKGNKGRWGKCNPLDVGCSVDSDCGTSGYMGDYYCDGGDVYRNYNRFTCVNPGNGGSSCINGTTAVLIDGCRAGEECVEGQSECQEVTSNVTFDLALRIADCATINTDCEELYDGVERYGCALGGATVTLAALNQWNSYSAQLIVNSGESSEVGDAPSGRSEWIKFKNIPVWTGTRDYSSDNGFYRITTTKNGYTSKTGLVGIFGTTGSDLYWSRESIGNYICLNAMENQTTPPEVPDTLTIKGRWIGHFTQEPIPGAVVSTWNNQTRYAVYTDANGEFAMTVDTTGISTTEPKGFGSWPSCYNPQGFGLSRNPDDSLYANLQYFPLIDISNSFPIQVIGSEVDMGTIPLWPAVTIKVFSDILVEFRIEFSGRIGSGNLNYKTEHTLSNGVPLNSDVRIKLTDTEGNVYYSPTINIPLSHGCDTVTLNLFNGQFEWVGITTEETNTCTDSDNEQDINVYGSVSGNLDGSAYIHNDYCIDDRSVMEYYCVGDNYDSQVKQCGNDGFIGAQYCIGDTVYQDFKDYYCNSGKCTFDETPTFIEQCEFGCSGGECRINYLTARNFIVSYSDLEAQNCGAGLISQEHYACRAKRWCTSQGYETGFESEWGFVNQQGEIHCFSGNDVNKFVIPYSYLEAQGCGAGPTSPEHYACRAKRWCVSQGYETGYQSEWDYNTRTGEVSCFTGEGVDIYLVSNNDLEAQNCGAGPTSPEHYACRAKRWCVSHGYDAGFQSEWGADYGGVVYCIRGLN